MKHGNSVYTGAVGAAVSGAIGGPGAALGKGLIKSKISGGL